jgi:hypothetical protein
VVNDDAGHRKSAQEVDLEVPGAPEVRPPTAGHARGKGKTGARSKSTGSALWATTPDCRQPCPFDGGPHERTTFPDTPHYQLVTGKKLAEVRECVEAGKPFVSV